MLPVISFKKHHLHVFNDIVVITKEKKTPQETPQGRVIKYKYLDSLPLKKLITKELPSTTSVYWWADAVMLGW